VGMCGVKVETVTLFLIEGRKTIKREEGWKELRSFLFDLGGRD